MKKICHVTSVHPHLDVRIFRKECVSLAKSGYDVTLVEIGSESTTDNIQGVHIIGVKFTPKNRIDRILHAARAAYKSALEVDADIYHLHDPELIPYGMKLLRRGKKVIFDSHENIGASISEKEYIPAVARKLLASLYNAYEKQTLSKYNAVVSVTPDVCRRLSTINPKTYQITNYPILTDVAAATEKIPRSVCFAGGIKEEWNHETVIKAINELPDKGSYELFGFGADEYINAIQSIDKGNCLHYHGKIPHTSVQSELSKCTCGIALCTYNKNMNGRNGSLGNTKLFEYMMAGLPVICTDYELWKKIIAQYSCGICTAPDDVESIKNAMEYIFCTPGAAAQMGQNGRRAVEQEYNWASQEQILLRLYSDIRKG